MQRGEFKKRIHLRYEYRHGEEYARRAGDIPERLIGNTRDVDYVSGPVSVGNDHADIPQHQVNKDHRTGLALAVIHDIEIRAGDDFRLVIETYLSGDVFRGDRMVARYHDDTDPRPPAQVNRDGDVLPHRVMQSKEAQKSEFKIMLRLGKGTLFKRGHSNAYHAASLSGQSIDVTSD